jgi:multicomponent Na+:H+ antiporter subunit G
MAPETFSAGEIIALIFVAIGVIFMLISSIGILRLPDVYSRMHAAGKSTTVGVSFVLLGAGVYFWEQHLFARMLLLIVLIFATSPISTSAMARAVYRTSAMRQVHLKHDEIKGETP